MKIISGFFVYRVYISYKAHFSSTKTDISKYKFKLFNPPYEQFMNTKGHSFFDKIAKRMKTEKEVTTLFIAAFLEDPDIWIGTVCMDLPKYIDLKEKREAILQDMPYRFAKDCKTLLEAGLRFNDTMGNFVFSKFMDGSISLESFIVMKKIFKFDIDNNPTYDYIYEVKYYKYELLLEVNIKKYKQILQEVIMQLRD